MDLDALTDAFSLRSTAIDLGADASLGCIRRGPVTVQTSDNAI